MRKNRLTCLMALAIIMMQLTLPVSATLGMSDLWDAVVTVIMLPAQLAITITWPVIIGELTYNPQMFCLPGTSCTTNPGPGCCQVEMGVDVLIEQWFRIMAPFYVIAMLFTGLFFVIKAGSPRGRARARSMLLRLLFGMVVVALAPLIYQAMIELSEMIVRMFLEGHEPEVNFGVFKMPLQLSPFGDVRKKADKIALGLTKSRSVSVTLSCIFAYLSALIILFGAIIVWVRNMLVFFYGVFFPMILFLYSFEITKPYGRKWFNASLKWVFAPALQALILAFTVTLSDSMDGLVMTGGTLTIQKIISDSLAGMIVVAGICFFVLAPFVTGMLMSWLGNAVIAVGLGSGRTWMVAVGGLLAGQGASALPFAHAEFTRMRAYERYQSGLRGGAGALGSAPSGGFMGSTGGSPSAGGGGSRRQLPAEGTSYGPVFGSTGRTAMSMQQQQRPGQGGEGQGEAPAPGTTFQTPSQSARRIRGLGGGERGGGGFGDEIRTTLDKKTVGGGSSYAETAKSRGAPTLEGGGGESRAAGTADRDERQTAYDETPRGHTMHVGGRQDVHIQQGGVKYMRPDLRREGGAQNKTGFFQQPTEQAPPLEPGKPKLASRQPSGQQNKQPTRDDMVSMLENRRWDMIRQLAGNQFYMNIARQVVKEKMESEKDRAEWQAVSNQLEKIIRSQDDRERPRK
ncbi:MAG: hypothetical protein GF416_04120 [Candidatus Altiarchaeales archaeon]|nr:hypothetical protein [Candidatus Altiarchaeales archaeon]MBD3416306.1 hypothetical protein [Candidatus Altiarchaeales archaeon]